MEHQQDEEDLQMALLMSLQNAPSEAKRSKPPEDAEESPEARGRRLRREVMAAAAERRMATSRSGGPGESRPGTNAVAVPEASVSAAVESPRAEDRVDGQSVGGAGLACLRTKTAGKTDPKVVAETRRVDVGELSLEDANRLFFMLFGGAVSKSILLQWINQGIRYFPTL